MDSATRIFFRKLTDCYSKTIIFALGIHDMGTEHKQCYVAGHVHSVAISNQLVSEQIKGKKLRPKSISLCKV